MNTLPTSDDLIKTAQSIFPLLNPRSVAIIGASRKHDSIGEALLANMVGRGYSGKIFPVNPVADELMGLKVLKSVEAIPEPVDLAIIALPAALVENAMISCASLGVKTAVIISSGFAEVSAIGRAVQDRIMAIARNAGMRVVGPNCMGVLNTENKLDATFAPDFPPRGHVGILSQSGALGVAILDNARRLNLGISSFVSVGNNADISATDLLAYWRGDAQTKVIGLYMESFGNPRVFPKIAQEVAREKPIVAVKSGRTASGSRAAESHSAALAGMDVAVDALFKQAGVIRTSTLEGLFDVIALLSTQSPPRGPRVGVVTNAGGPGILLADALDSWGLELPEPDERTKNELRTFLPAQAGLGNPVDMIASATPEQYQRAIEVMGHEDNIDAIIAIFVPPRMSYSEQVGRAIAQAAGNVPDHKPVLSVFLSANGAPEVLGMGPRGSLPAYAFPENAARALAAAEWYGRWRREPVGHFYPLKDEEKNAIRAVVNRILDLREEPVWVSQKDLSELLAIVGVEMAVARFASLDEAGEIAEEMGYPLVAKVISPDVLHKSDVGGVKLGLRNQESVLEAVDIFREKMKRISAHLEGVLLQREIKGGIEAFVGVTSDATFGPLILCGLGGVQVELLRDISFRLPPVSDKAAESMIQSLKSAVLLDGFRGAPPGDRHALVSVITRISALVEVIPELTELDLNPVKVLMPGQGAVAVDGRMRLNPLSSH